jgi:beta-galactosidase
MLKSPVEVYLAAAIMTVSIVPSLHAQRRTISFDTAWSYLEAADPAPSTLASYPSYAWRLVDLPHTWNRFDATDAVPGYRRGASWYRRTLDLSGFGPASRVVLYLEGANTVADVFVNGVRAGRHAGGYVGFRIDITPYVHRDARNELAVRVDNTDSPDLIPSDKSDFSIFGGLTRNVWLEVVPEVSIGAVQVRTPEVSAKRARATISVEIRNLSRESGSYSARSELRAPGGKVAATGTTHFDLDSDTLQTATIDIAVQNPALWSPASPSLYHVVTTLIKAGNPIDQTDDRVGFRWYSFAPSGPFFLNGQRLLLRGTQRHEDYAGFGAAVPDSLDGRDMAMIKAMGANFVRLAHYPQAPSVYRAADSLGLLVWDELPWDRGGVGGPVWQANTKRLLREQIRQNINHPSIVVWSLGNEISDVIEPPNRGDTASLRGFLTDLRGIARELDPARPTATRKFDAGADIVDVYSPSIWAGWYGGVYRQYETAILAAHKKFPNFIHMEYGADAHYGRHTETPISGEGLKIEQGAEEAVGKPVANVAREGDWSESYQTDLLDWHLGVSERQPWLTGTAQWVFKDFPTPLRPENPIPYVNEKGLLTRDGTPKDAYYLYKSYWTTSPKFVYLVSHTWTERSGPESTPRMVRAYSNCASVELLLNGQSQGVKPRAVNDFPAQGLRWNVRFSAGANSLVARCTDAGETAAADSLRVSYTFDAPGKPQDIRLSESRLSNGHLLVEATLVDAKGRRSLGASDRIYFDHSGGGGLVADLGTPTGSRVVEAANGRAAIEVIPPPRGTRAIVVARTQQLNGARLIIDGRAD